MALLTVNEGEVELIDRMLATSVVMKLYTNDKTPAATDEVDDYTEATDGNYEEATLTGGNWSTSAVSGVGTAEYAQQTFSFGGTTTVYGYYVTNVAGDTLLWAERFSPASTFGSSGGTVNVTPKITMEASS